MTKQPRELVLDDEFDGILPKLTAEEFAQLERNILDDGEIRDSLVVWKGQDILIDGYNRYAISQKHNLPFNILQLPFNSRTDVAIWIGNNARGRRNMTKNKWDLYVGNWYHVLKQGAGGDQKSDESIARSEAMNGLSAAGYVAQQTGVSERTVMRLAEKAETVEQLAAPVRKAFEASEIDLSKKELEGLAKLPKSEQVSIVKQVESGEKESVASALPKEKKPPRKKVESEGKTPAALMKEWNSLVESAAKEIKNAAKNLPEGPWLDDNRLAMFNSQIESALATLRWSKCSDLCPKCEGEGCKVCHDMGFMPSQVFEMRSSK